MKRYKSSNTINKLLIYANPLTSKHILIANNCRFYMNLKRKNLKAFIILIITYTPRTTQVFALRSLNAGVNIYRVNCTACNAPSLCAYF